MVKKKTNKFLKSFFYLFFFVAVAGGSYYVGSHQEQVTETVRQHAPHAKEYLKEATDKVKGLSVDSFSSVGDYAKTGIEKSREILEEGRAILKDEAPATRTASSSEPTHSAPTASLSDKIKICSFNIRVFSNNSRDEKELQHIANILKHYDLIAIQELRDKKVLDRTVNKLKDMGYSYKYEMSRKVGRGVKEIYAFLYRTDKIEVTSNGQLYPEMGDEFIREPYFASFKSGNFDFTLLTIHLLYGNSKKHRRPELVNLADVYDYVVDQNPQEKDIIVLGDFNFDPEDEGWVRMKRYQTMTYLIKPPAKTTITDTSLYDNFWFQKSYVKEYTGKAGITKFDENIFQNDDREAKLSVSDHRPIWAEFKVTSEDDD